MKSGKCLVILGTLIVAVDITFVDAMEVKKPDTTNQTTATSQTVSLSKEPVVPKEQQDSLEVVLERITKVTISSTSSDDKVSPVEEQYAEFLAEFLKQFNIAFEKMVNDEAWVKCDFDTNGEVTFTTVEVDHKALREKLITMLSKQQDEVKDAEDVAKVAVPPTKYWGLAEKFSWIPLYLFRKGLMALLTEGALVPAGLVSLILLACPDWISTVLLQDVLPLAAKHMAVTLAETALKTMQVSQEWYTWTLNFVKSSLIG